MSFKKLISGLQGFEIMWLTISDFHKYGTLDRISVLVEVNRPCYAFIRAGFRYGVPDLFPISGVRAYQCFGQKHHCVISKRDVNELTFRMNIIFFDKRPGLIRKI